MALFWPINGGDPITTYKSCDDPPSMGDEILNTSTFKSGCLTWFRYRVSIHHPLGFKDGTPTSRCWCILGIISSLELSGVMGIYTPVIKHSNGKSPFSIGNTSSKGSFSIAMLDYQRVLKTDWVLGPVLYPGVAVGDQPGLSRRSFRFGPSRAKVLIMVLVSVLQCETKLVHGGSSHDLEVVNNHGDRKSPK